MVDLQKKINFLFHVVYNESYNELTKAFIPKNYPSLKEIRSRKVTIKKWLAKPVKSVNKFYNEYYNYPISEFYFLNGEEVFPLTAFTEWSLDEFEIRYYEYQNEKNSNMTDNNNYKISLVDYHYIYYYLEAKKRLSYFKIDYFDNDEVQFTTFHNTQIITYKGHIKRHTKSSILHYIVENDFEMMFFSFSKLDLKLNKYAYGIGLSKDFQLKNPKASFVILSQEKLSEEKKEEFQTKINPTNIIIVDNEKQTKEESFIKNLSTHIREISEISFNYKTKNIFLNLFLEEIKLFNNKFYNFQNKYEFQFTSFSSSMAVMLNLLRESKDQNHIQVLYTLENIDNSLFSPIDDLALSLYAFIVDNSKKKKISFEFVIALSSRVVIDKKLKTKFQEFEEAGISLRFRNYRDIFSYSTLILVDKYKLAVSCIKGENEYITTKSSTDINKLKKEYTKQRSYAKFLHNILEKNYILNGTYYMYSYGSNNDLYIEKLAIDGENINGIILTHNNLRYQGKIHRIYEDILLCTEYGIIKFKKEYEHNIIKIVSILADQENGNRQPLIMFAILSRVELEEQDRDDIFSVMVDKECSPHEKSSFQLSLSLYETLRPLLFKYERIEREGLYKNT